tara:strand:- start:37485 stop:37751 length:267 start_codon:yes stop_codon:yes gene_type:complete
MPCRYADGALTGNVNPLFKVIGLLPPIGCLGVFYRGVANASGQKGCRKNQRRCAPHSFHPATPTRKAPLPMLTPVPTDTPEFDNVTEL